ncbi:MAG: right-handed parallel beta-helix repeat-containing protein, partial [Candidatus Thermoplasmatota archaeon]
MKKSERSYGGDGRKTIAVLVFLAFMVTSLPMTAVQAELEDGVIFDVTEASEIPAVEQGTKVSEVQEGVQHPSDLDLKRERKETSDYRPEILEEAPDDLPGVREKEPSDVSTAKARHFTSSTPDKHIALSGKDLSSKVQLQSLDRSDLDIRTLSLSGLVKVQGGDLVTNLIEANDPPVVASIPSPPAITGTPISGSITTTTWNVAGSPYWIEGDAWIPFGQTLTIDPGVDVLFNGSFSIYVDGTLNANGAIGNMVDFTSNPAPITLLWDDGGFESNERAGAVAGDILAQEFFAPGPCTIVAAQIYIDASAAAFNLVVYDTSVGPPFVPLSSTPVLAPVLGWNNITFSPGVSVPSGQFLVGVEYTVAGQPLIGEDQTAPDGWGWFYWSAFAGWNSPGFLDDLGIRANITYAQPGDWGTIQFNATGNGQISYSNITYATDGITVNGATTGVRVNNSIIDLPSNYGIYVLNGARNTVIDSNTVNAIGSHGIFLENSIFNPTITGNSVTAQNGDGIRLTHLTNQPGTGTVTITGNTVDTPNTGIYLNIYVDANTAPVTFDLATTINNNTISNCGDGISMFIYPGSYGFPLYFDHTGTINNNSITSPNMGTGIYVSLEPYGGWDGINSQPCVLNDTVAISFNDISAPGGQINNAGIYLREYAQGDFSAVTLDNTANISYNNLSALDTWFGIMVEMFPEADNNNDSVNAPVYLYDDTTITNNDLLFDTMYVGVYILSDSAYAGYSACSLDSVKNVTDNNLTAQSMLLGVYHFTASNADFAPFYVNDTAVISNNTMTFNGGIGWGQFFTVFVDVEPTTNTGTTNLNSDIKINDNDITMWNPGPEDAYGILVLRAPSAGGAASRMTATTEISRNTITSYDLLLEGIYSGAWPSANAATSVLDSIQTITWNTIIANDQLTYGMDVTQGPSTQAGTNYHNDTTELSNNTVMTMPGGFVDTAISLWEYPTANNAPCYLNAVETFVYNTVSIESGNMGIYVYISTTANLAPVYHTNIMEISQNTITFQNDALAGIFIDPMGPPSLDNSFANLTYNETFTCINNTITAMNRVDYGIYSYMYLDGPDDTIYWTDINLDRIVDDNIIAINDDAGIGADFGVYILDDLNASYGPLYYDASTSVSNNSISWQAFSANNTGVFLGMNGYADVGLGGVVPPYPANWVVTTNYRINDNSIYMNGDPGDWNFNGISVFTSWRTDYANITLNIQSSVSRNVITSVNRLIFGIRQNTSLLDLLETWLWADVATT